MNDEKFAKWFVIIFIVFMVVVLIYLLYLSNQQHKAYLELNQIILDYLNNC